MGRKKTYTDEEMLESLRKEIERLGLEDNLGRTNVQKKFDINRMPHPRTFEDRFGSWSKALEKAGYEYNGSDMISKTIKKSNAGKRHAATWSNMPKEDVINAMVKEIRKKSFDNVHDYRQKRDKENSPSDITVRALTGMNWGDIKKIAWDDKE